MEYRHMRRGWVYSALRREGLFFFCNYLMAGCREDEARAFSEVHSGQTRDNEQNWYTKEILTQYKPLLPSPFFFKTPYGISGYSERLLNLCPWKYSEFDWTKCWAICFQIYYMSLKFDVTSVLPLSTVHVRNEDQ